MLSCAGADRLQTGMRGAFGKPQGTCARVAIGQVLLSVRCKDNNAQHAEEALRRAKFKFPGRQKIIVSGKWGFTKFTRAEYIKYKSEGRLVPDGVNAKVYTLYSYNSLEFHNIILFFRWLHVKTASYCLNFISNYINVSTCLVVRSSYCLESFSFQLCNFGTSVLLIHRFVFIFNVTIGLSFSD
ncbi:60S ribosomal protein L10-1-like protein [Carex littledalei]|uniref:60S ribosomal protein L10-1-like protein n=1 Tax=Carex littledalei TaxID=544730 RepID=A0A833RAE0_9POAL|nr:60S ribosomal protein L10-1-like protein [Carex littledalei]